MGDVLLADADVAARQRLRSALEEAGHAVREAATSGAALDAARARRPDCVVVEAMFPGEEPFGFVHAVKQERALASVKLVVVSARSAEVDRVVAFELGVDDYVAKPFSLREMVLRVAAVLRRRERDTRQHVGPLVIDRGAARVFVGDGEVSLTKLERDILLDLVDAAGAVRTREDLVRSVLGNAPVRPRAVDSHVKRLRAKLGSAAEVVETVKGVGYRLAR